MASYEIQIRKGDCIAGLKKLEPETVALVFADPPYNLSRSSLVNLKSKTGGAFHKINEDWDRWEASVYATFTRDWIASAYEALKPNGSIYVCGSHHNLGVLLLTLESVGFETKNIIVWEKPNAMPSMTRRTFTHSVEFIVWAIKGKNWIFDYEALKGLNPDKQKDGSPKMMRDVWRFPVVQGAERLRGIDGRALHPTQKPEALVERCIAASTKPGDLVVDPFVGSGTTAVVAKRLKRAFVGFETNEVYVKAARARVKKTAIQNS
jgi:site-specific DNA-methyltransferase (adenine-specific)/modification methylase